MFSHSFFIVHYVVAFLVSVHLVINARSSQAILAWLIALIFIPYISLLFYIFFGYTRFSAYTEAIQKSGEAFSDEMKMLANELKDFTAPISPDFSVLNPLMKNMSDLTFTKGNHIRLLINGGDTYAEIFQAIEKAQHYILLQYYIVRNDRLGRKLKTLLLKKAAQGLSIYFLYDAWGSKPFFHQYVRQLRKAGVHVASFQEAKGSWRNRWQINFRNHRKIVIVDGFICFTGGINLGEEYLAKRLPKAWRDTHLRLQGPTVQHMQLSFCEDWYWADRTTLNLNWHVTNTNPDSIGQLALVVPTGPERSLQTAALLITQLINLAKQRLWIATPYFVPDRTILTALQLAVLRGVEVKILLPNSADHWLVYACSFSFYTELQDAGIQFYRYQKGFMHQKVILIDDELSSIGTINLDNRSLYINFELTALVVDRLFAQQVETMLEKDFSQAKSVELKDYAKMPFWFKLWVGFSRLFAPLL
jgi:cardiolipin synthase